MEVNEPNFDKFTILKIVWFDLPENVFSLLEN
jgi:hypothetical protein